ncbi:quinone oxidoreductase [Diplodia corticola]|uniref:Quinone oxidoreductase n=1 Tax=Diplodia corticola TaxID=236234 RepID=A0A1J9QLA4_9PEZI|nr:quinone oxidoreductase [Diplodia corticola]OJD29241.1 quinone oxidoreductase [Diplodia corticola]
MYHFSTFASLDLFFLCALFAAFSLPFLFLRQRMIGQAEVRAPVWANLKRELTIDDLKANAAAKAAVNRHVKPFQSLKEGGGVVVDTTPSSPSLANQQHSTPPPPPPDVPTMQTVLMLYQPRTRYALTPKHDIPSLRSDDEVLIKVKAIGLNPIDWKAPDFGFGIPTLPYISGRDFVGTIVDAHDPSSPLHPSTSTSSSSSSACPSPSGTIPPSSSSSSSSSTTTTTTTKDQKTQTLYLAISTDYRDPRKSAFQQYAVATAHTVCRLPAALPAAAGATLGVAFVAAALALGVCFGLDFSSRVDPSTSSASGSDPSSSSSSSTGGFLATATAGPDFRALLAAIPAARIPGDCLAEAHLHAGADDQRRQRQHQRAKKGDWLVLWGGSSTTARIAARLAGRRGAGMRVVAVGDVVKHGGRIVGGAGAGGGGRGGGDEDVDLWVDSHDPERAAEVVRGVVGGDAGVGRFGVDFVGRETAARLARALDSGEGSGPPAHLVGLAAGPKGVGEGVRVHSVPIKLFHEVPEVGRATMAWLERLLEEGLLTPPEVVVEEGGLAGVNGALDRMRRGEISGKRLAVELD